jgi:hypothetical protein
VCTLQESEVQGNKKTNLSEYTVGMPLYKSLGEATSPPLVFQKNNLFLNFVP